MGLVRRGNPEAESRQKEVRHAIPYGYNLIDCQGQRRQIDFPIDIGERSLADQGWLLMMQLEVVEEKDIHGGIVRPIAVGEPMVKSRHKIRCDPRAQKAKNEGGRALITLQ